MGIPLREFYPVNRAAELLKCQTGDLFHWAAIGAISLYVHFETGRGYALVGGKFADVERRLAEELLVSDGPSYINTIFNRDSKDCVDFLARKCERDEALPCNFSGFWSLPGDFLGLTGFWDVKPGMNDFWFSANKSIIICFESDEYLSPNIEDVYVMKSDFKLLMSCNDMDELPNYYNGGVEVIKKGEEPNVRSESAKERHAKNELLILSAAIKFKETNVSTFNEKCLKKDGDYNFAAWAREVADRVHLFPDGTCPVKSVDTITSYISRHFKF